MPYPFSRGVFIAAPPISVRAQATPEEMEEARSALERTLNAITAEADNYFS
ncbi:MAG: hypothetical protein HZB82_03010 [Deltaproteobacteria bacterium]|nr:hypothetical protein [Deltaproteobacteria bacterium]